MEDKMKKMTSFHLHHLYRQEYLGTYSMRLTATGGIFQKQEKENAKMRGNLVVFLKTQVAQFHTRILWEFDDPTKSYRIPGEGIALGSVGVGS
ncbi:unnamed protein product [Adineta ricciae]|uniref:Uncharacterized protein n=1 Tax=Adineta ricciae TaxID=249248 RepID=A0A815S4Y4_ADIRI|nr:unnamed protein product [Adineta ricciae]